MDSATVTATILESPMIRNPSPGPPMIGAFLFGQVVDMEDIERFFDRVLIWPNGCWMWLVSVSEDGYGGFYCKGKKVSAHRYSYLTFNGEIPVGLQIDHRCNTPSCVNPVHLDVVTPKENSNRGTKNSASRTHCPKGHLYSYSNTRYTINVRGGHRRQCLECERVRTLARDRGPTLRKALEVEG